MNTATLTDTAADSRPIADILNQALETQATDSPLDRLDRCDRCNQAAQSIFTFKEADVLLCGHHMRHHLIALMAQNPTEFWVSPSELWKVKGVKVPAREKTLTGDGLTDA